MADLVDICAETLGIKRDLALQIAKSAPYRFRRLEKKKSGGGVRVIWQAAIETKGLHYPLIEHLFRKLPVHSASQAFSPGCSIKKNAEQHIKGKYFLRIDFSDFFPTITFSALTLVLKKNIHALNGLEICNKDSLFFIEKCCFDRSGRLPIGYATSPYIANCVMHEFDYTLQELLVKKFSQFEIVYTRYADDLVFSTDTPGICKKVFYEVRDHVLKTKSLKLQINHSKTHFGSTAKGSAYVTGVHMLPNGRTAATRSFRSEIRLFLSLSRKKKLSDKDQMRLFGLLSHLKNIDAAFYTKLATDYYDVFPREKSSH